MLRRSFYQTLLDWKHDKTHRALLVDGARQVGKTSIIEDFLQREYEGGVTIDFIKDERAARLLASAHDVRQLIERITLLAGRELPERGGIVFFDEVQEAQNIVTLSKYLIDDGRFDVVMSGSLLGIELTRVKSFPVGYLSIKCMHPLTFEEFCWSQGVPDSVLGQVRDCYASRMQVDGALHERLIDLFRLYVVTGGMPAVVQAYIDSGHNLGRARTIQESLVGLYREDIAKRAPAERRLQIKAIFDAMPAQLAKENKRFQFQTLRRQAKYERYADDFAWLVGARAALKAMSVAEPKLMLRRTEEAGRFKLYSSDVGMLMSQYPLAVAADVLSGTKSVNFGGVYENAVAQELAAAGSPLHYFRNSRKGEVDFLMETAGATVLPIEVKSGKDYKLHLALNNLLGTEAYAIEQAIVLSEANVSVGERAGKPVWYLPLYMAGLLASESAAAGSDGDFVFEPPRWA